jgi:type IV secretion system protein VirD4
MMLDEFAQLGHLAVIERNMALLRGYGIKLWAVLQDLSQLKDAYSRRWESFIGNAGIIQSFAPQDVTTREYLSKLSGQRLYWLNTHSSTTSREVSGSGGNVSEQSGVQHFQGPVYWEQGLAQMSAEQSVLFYAGLQPRRTILPDPEANSPGMEIIKAMLEAANTIAAQHEVK